MSKGAFVVYRDKQDPRDIHFESIVSDTPEDQLQLKDDVEKALIVLRGLFPDGKGRFEDYFRPLLSLAQCGLVGDAANPGLSARALTSLKTEVTAREGGTVKNRYMKTLGLRAAFAGGPTLVLALVLLHFVPRYGILANFLVLWSGCMAGVWLSFGARKATFKFEDLHIPEQDRLEPMIRLFFAGFLTVILALLFSVGAVSVTLGSITTSDINSQFRVALLVGMLCGFSEQILSSKVAKQASGLLDFAKK